ncbi:MAG: LytTR family DNA-binding domain-containing protein [Gammaproteobacteria bacterium]|nr:LytTR family DNA-binding domain-containing protein [Gammaproteobacteria bacterium]
MRILIADDENLARDRLRSMVESLGEEVCGEAGNGAEVLTVCAEQMPDVVLLDIRMPGMDGLEAAQHLAQLDDPPAVIFTTAYDEHALSAFETNAIDYLLKPVRKERLQQALEKAVKLNRVQINAIRKTEDNQGRTHISVNTQGKLQLIPVDEVFYFAADQKYVTVRYKDGEQIITETLKTLEDEFKDHFIRIHRNALVASEYIRGMEKDNEGHVYIVLKDIDEKLEVSKRHVADVKEFIKGK